MAKLFTSILSTFFVLIFLSTANGQGFKRQQAKVGLDLSPEAAAERWVEFSSSKLGSDYCMLFELIHRPRKSEEIKYVGYMFGAERTDGLYMRLRIAPASHPSNSEEFIMKNSSKGCDVWKFKDGKFVKLSKADWLKPLYDGLLYTPFDLLMPYKFWNASYIGAGRIGQAVHLFDLTSTDFPFDRVRVALTRDFNVPAQIQLLGKNSKKTANLGSVKKVDNLWFMREASVKDEISKDKDILRFTHARFNIILPKSIFDEVSQKNVKLPELKKL
ncbi:MAG: hypothetical protein E7035_09930 [Verrucomicrobiaceae bacterium]|nr:hypothetical protein [Verrucomicrobiaceae bacterium]